MLDKFLNKGNKEEETNTKATDRLGYMHGSIPAWQTPSMSAQRSRAFSSLMERFDGWIYAACMVNARGVAAQTLKLYAKQPKTGAKSLLPTEKVTSQKQAFLQGKLESKPSTFVQRKAMQGEVVEVFDHPILELLDNPSPEMDGYTLTIQRILNLQLTGNAYLHPIISESLGVPVELWNMQSDLVTIIPDGELDLVDSYAYGRHPNVTEFRRDEVLHEKQPNPSDPFYGRGWVSAALGAADLLESMDDYEQNVLDNQARPDWAVMVNEHLTDAQYQRLMQQIERQLGGSSNRSRPFIFEGGTDGKPMSFSPQDLAFASGEARKIEVIAAISGVPVSKLKANDPNLANAREGNMGWLRDTIVPYLKLDEQFLNRNLLPMFGEYASNLFLCYDDPVTQDRQAQASIDSIDASAGIRTRNEIRSDRGLEPVEGGDELLVPAGTVPIDVAVEQARNPQPQPMPFGAFATEPTDVKAEGDCPEGSHWMPPDEDHPDGWCMRGESHPSTYSIDKADDCVSSKIRTLLAEGYERSQAVAIAYSMCGKQENQTEAKSHDDCGCNSKLVSCQKSLFESHRSLIGEKRAPIDDGNEAWKETEKQNKPASDTFLNTLESVFRRQVNRFLDTGMSSVLFDTASQDEMANAASEFVKEVMGNSGQQELNRLVPDMELDFNFLSPDIANALEDYTAQLTTTLATGTQRELDRKIETGVRNGLGTDEIARSIAGLLEEEPKTGIIPIRARAEMIARTELAMIHEEGKLQAWKESGVVQFKQWQLSAGACESCKALAVMRPIPIPVDEPFAKSGQIVGKIKVWRNMMTAPLHPNCRCGTIEVLGDETELERQFVQQDI
tara:strand:+ start:551 stop:3076 length:2526 start_codon:yes stop_codon:yes gene_type:complete